MTKLMFKLMAVVPMILGAVILGSPSAKAQSAPALEQVLQYGENTGDTRIGQVTSVSQLTDVKPTDWAFQALQSLVERYGCIAGYPDRTFRGNRALTRYEFAAGLNACLDRVNELIASSTADFVKKEDLAAVKKMQQDFAKELAELKGTVDGLEARTDKLEKQQFSTTTKLNAEVVVGLSGALGDERAIDSDQQRLVNAALTPAAADAAKLAALGGATRGVQKNTTFGNRVRLSFDASFTGKDRLRARLQARNIAQFAGASGGGATGTSMTRLGVDGDNSNTVELNRLEYRFPLTPLTTVYIGGGNNDGLEFNDSIPTLSPQESSGSGAISRFGRFNPILRANTGTGIIFNHKLGKEFSFGEKFTISAGYLVPSTVANNPAPKNGLFDGNHTALAQVVFQPTPKIGVGVTYANSFYAAGTGVSGGTGSVFANNPFSGNATSANSYSIQANVRVAPKFALSGWVGVTDATSRERSAGGTFDSRVVNKGDRAKIWNWAVAATFPDLLKEGDLGGIIFGMPPKVTSTDFGPNIGATPTTARRRDRDTSYHLEGFYRYKLNDNISITPGLLVIFNPEQNKSNDTTYVGTVRTTFIF